MSQHVRYTKEMREKQKAGQNLFCIRTDDAWGRNGDGCYLEVLGTCTDAQLKLLRDLLDSGSWNRAGEEKP